MTYQQTLELLYSMMPDFQRVGAQAYKPGLERIREFDRYLGSRSKEFHSIHVAGTNGKGSVSHMLAAVLQEAGYKVGLYTSPHLKDFRERIRVDGEMISERAVVEFANRNMEKMRELDLSFFEATVGMAYEFFATSRVEVAVVETGLGGRLDATNIINPLLSVITNIGIEHTEFLGDTLEKIAAEKAGIIKLGVPVVVGERSPHTDPVFKRIAEQNQAKLFFAQDMFKCLDVRHRSLYVCSYKMEYLPKSTQFEVGLDLTGDYQRYNIVTALAAIDVMNSDTPLTISRRSINCGLATTAATSGFRGRWQVIGSEPLTVCDTGHNADGIRQVAEQINRQKFDKLYMVFGVANDKDLNTILPLLPTEAHYIFTQASGSRALPAQELSRKATEYGLKGEVVPQVRQAVVVALSKATARDMIFIGGSSFVVAEIE